MAEFTTEFIAEISSNHNANRKRCFEMIKAAAQCGCHGVKFQLFRIDQLFAPEILQVSQGHRQRRRWELPLHFLKDLASCCRDEGVLFGCTPFDLQAVDILEPLTDFLKIASYELPWLGLIDHCASTGQPLMMSTGMANIDECQAAVQTARQAGCEKLTVFHCVSNYPAPAAQCNLSAIESLRRLLGEDGGRVGWSDHSRSAAVVKRAVDYWQAEAVEFHFDLEGQGEEFGAGHCWLPEDIAPVIAGVSSGDEIVQALNAKPAAGPQCDGLGQVAPTDSEMEERTWRADPEDGLRPTRPVRLSWPATQEEVLGAERFIVFYAAGMGMGHVARCVALAEALRSHHRSRILFYIQGTPGQKALLERHGFAWQVIADEQNISQLLADYSLDKSSGSVACVLDMLADASSLASQIKTLKIPVVVLDQPSCQEADLVLVPSFGWASNTSSKKLKGGTDYLLIREDIRVHRCEKTPSCASSRLVVSFGGKDPNRLTEKVIQALAHLSPEPEIQIIVGPGFAPFRAETQAVLKANPQMEIIDTGVPLEVVLNRSDLVVTALGVTVAEAHVLGVPVALLANWPDDAEPVERLVNDEMVFDLGLGTEIDPENLTERLNSLWSDVGQRQDLALRGWQMVDGLGAARMAEQVCELMSEKGGQQC